MDGAFDIGSVVAKVKADLSGFTQGMDQAKAQAESLGESFGNTVDKIRGFAEQAAVVVGVQTVAFGELAKQAIDVASNFEQTQTSFGTLLGSEQKAADLMKEIMQFEMHTPFDIQTLTDAAKQMLAFGVNSKDVVPIMKELTDMSQGQSFKLKELVSIYGQVNSIQQLNGREVLRLSSIGIPIYQAIEDHFKKIGDTSMDSGEKVKKAIAAGSITGKDFNEILQEMTSKGGLFFNENIRQMSTFSGIMSSTQSQLQYAMLNILGIDLGAANEVRKGGLFDTLRTLAANLLEWLGKLQPVFKEVGQNKTFQLAIEGMVVALASLAIIIPVVILALNPVFLVVVAIEALIVALYVAWNTNFMGIRDITRVVVNNVMDFFNNYLIPLIKTFTVFWDATWPQVSALLLAVWNYIFSIIKLYWDMSYDLLKIGIDILTGNWSRAWNDIKQLLKDAWNDIIGILNTGLNLLKNIGGQILSAIVKPFEDAWNQISALMNKIKDALDFTKRHSPSVLDIVQNGVSLVNDALAGVKFSPNVSASQIASNYITPLSEINNPANSGFNLTIQLPNAIISDPAGANRMAEQLGNLIIGRLKQNIRF